MARTLRMPLAPALLAICSLAGAGGQSTTPVPHISWGGSSVTGFKPFRMTHDASGIHFVAVQGPGNVLTFVSKERGLTATCKKAEGYLDPKNVVQKLTLTGGVHAIVLRPSSEKTSKEVQTATADGEEAVYTGSDNTLRVTGGVTLDDADPGVSRAIHATGQTADVVLSPEGSKEQAFQSAIMDGNIKMQMLGTRLLPAEGKKPARRVPFSMHATCQHATFNGDTRTVVLHGSVHVTSDDPGGDSYMEQETIHLNPDGSIDSVDGDGSPGMTTIDLGATGH